MLVLLGFGILTLAALYLFHVNCAMKVVPEEARRLSPRRWTVEEARGAYQKCLEDPVDVINALPPKQSRRYVIVGGSGVYLKPALRSPTDRVLTPLFTTAGLVGGWIVSHLLARGEEPQTLRVLDLQAPQQEILDQGVGYTKTNVTDELAVTTAFEEPWPAAVALLHLTVFHTAATIRPSERLKTFLPLCGKVNIDGTRNVLNAAKKAGASCLISTSSGSVSLRRPGFWIAPWKKIPERAVQILHDGATLPQRHEDFFGNYAVTKAEAERIVRSADDPGSNFRTGCIRPANGIYGIGSDSSMSITGIYLREGGSPT